MEIKTLENTCDYDKLMIDVTISAVDRGQKVVSLVYRCLTFAGLNLYPPLSSQAVVVINASNHQARVVGNLR